METGYSGATLITGDVLDRQVGKMHVVIFGYNVDYGYLKIRLLVVFK
jgi:hypothetical protein